MKKSKEDVEYSNIAATKKFKSRHLLGLLSSTGPDDRRLFIEKYWTNQSWRTSFERFYNFGRARYTCFASDNNTIVDDIEKMAGRLGLDRIKELRSIGEFHTEVMKPIHAMNREATFILSKKLVVTVRANGLDDWITFRVTIEECDFEDRVKRNATGRAMHLTYK